MVLSEMPVKNLFLNETYQLQYLLFLHIPVLIFHFFNIHPEDIILHHQQLQFSIFNLPIL